MADRMEQNYKNHTQIVPLYHRVLFGLLLLTFIGSIVNLTKSWGDSTRFYSASLIVALSLSLLLLAFLARVFALKAQDRAIRAEEQLRHYVLTGKLLDARLTMRQIVGLRFASNDEFVALAQRAADQSLTPDAIKQAVKQLAGRQTPSVVWGPPSGGPSRALHAHHFRLGLVQLEDGQQTRDGQQLTDARVRFSSLTEPP